MDALLENRDVWESVEVVMKKPPANVDCANVGIDPDSIKTETVLYDGPTRGICPKFPRNVNTHASIAYAGIGFDRTKVGFFRETGHSASHRFCAQSPLCDACELHSCLCMSLCETL